MKTMPYLRVSGFHCVKLFIGKATETTGSLVVAKVGERPATGRNFGMELLSK